MANQYAAICDLVNECTCDCIEQSDGPIQNSQGSLDFNCEIRVSWSIDEINLLNQCSLMAFQWQRRVES